MALNVQSIILLAIGIVVLAGVLPGAIETFEATDTSNWSSGTAAMFAVIIPAAVAGIVIGVIRSKGRS